MKKVFLLMFLAGGMLSACSTTSDKEAGQEQVQDGNGAASQVEMSSPDGMEADTADHSHSHSHGGGEPHEHEHEHNDEHKH